jgi:hypothetical protein
MVDSILLSQLCRAYDNHKHIIIGVDFDDTVFVFNETPQIRERCERVVEALKKASDFSTICLWSVASPQSLKYKAEIMKLYGIPPAYINESPIKKWGECAKPYWNIELDDKAGLSSSLATLEEFIKQIKIRNKSCE